MRPQGLTFTFQFLVLFGGMRVKGSILDFISNFPWLPANFDQILILTDSCTNGITRKDNGVYFACSHSLDLLDNLCIGDFSCTRSTAVLVSYLNTTNTEDAIYRIAALEHWHFFYFIFLPKTNNSTKYNTELMETAAHGVPIHADVYWILQEAAEMGNDQFFVWESYSVKKQAFVQPVPSSNIDDSSYFSNFVKNKWLRREDFRGSAIIATAVVDSDYEDEVKFTEDENGNLRLESGLAVDVYRIFKEQLNFTESVIEGDYILATKSTAAPGMEVHLTNGAADISITESTVGEDKAEVVQMLHATTSDWVEARFSRQPVSRFRFFRIPFTKIIWSLVAVHLVTMVLVFRLFHRFLSKLRNALVGDDSPFFSALWALGSLCLKSCYGPQKIRPLRVLFLVASVTGYLLNSSYIAVMTAQLSVKEKTAATLETLLDLKYNFYLEEDVPFPIDLEEFPQWQHISVTEINNDTDLLRAGQDVTESRSALVSFPEYFHAAMKFHNYSDLDACKMFETVRVSNRPTLCSMNVKKSSPFKEIFNLKTTLILSRGIVTRLYNKYKWDTLLKCTSKENKLIPQTPAELTLAYVILSAGTCGAFVILCLERLTAGTKMRSSLSRRMSMIHPLLYGL